MIASLLRRNCFSPLLLWKSGSPQLSYWRELEKSQYSPRQQLLELQWQRLLEMWHFVWDRNPFYQQRFTQAGLNRQSLASPDDLTRLPILTKKEIQDNTDSMISHGFAKECLLRFKTGGSTGKALDIYITQECSEQRNACARRHDRWTGWKPGEPIAAAWGNPKLPRTWKEKLKNALVQPMIYLDTMSVSRKSVQAFAAAWQKARPTMLFGHAHSLFLLAQYVGEMGLTGIRPKGILSTSMMLLPHERALIEKTFVCKVTDRYGCEEVSLIASECEEHAGMHLNIEHLYIEFLKENGEPASPGEEGTIIVTDLMNRAMPFIRYRVEDVGIPLDSTCPCGRGLPLMDKVIGRVADFLIKSDGTKIAGVSLIENTLTRIAGIEQMQIVQNELDQIVLNVVPGPDFDADRQKELTDYFDELFDNQAKITLQLLNEIKPEKSGKYRFSICKVHY